MCGRDESAAATCPFLAFVCSFRGSEAISTPTPLAHPRIVCIVVIKRNSTGFVGFDQTLILLFSPSTTFARQCRVKRFPIPPERRPAHRPLPMSCLTSRPSYGMRRGDSPIPGNVAPVPASRPGARGKGRRSLVVRAAPAVARDAVDHWKGLDPPFDGTVKRGAIHGTVQVGEKFRPFADQRLNFIAAFQGQRKTLKLLGPIDRVEHSRPTNVLRAALCFEIAENGDQVARGMTFPCAEFARCRYRPGMRSVF